MPQPRPPHSYRNPPHAEIDAAVTRAEAIRAVRAIRDRPKQDGRSAAPHPGVRPPDLS